MSIYRSIVFTFHLHLWSWVTKIIRPGIQVGEMKAEEVGYFSGTQTKATTPH